jgi:uncharacterized protein YjiS (DUF1127 family)
MSTVTVPTSAPTAFEAKEPRRKSLLRHAFATLFEARRVSAQRRIAFYLAGLSDARLADLGLSTRDIALIRAHRWPC